MKIKWSPEARRQISEIWHYIAIDNPHAADRMVTRLVAGIEKLVHFPNLGHPGREDSRELVIGGTNFIVVYRLDGEEIKIGSVLHGAQRSTTE